MPDLQISVVDKVVIVVIDALRADHLATALEPRMPFLKSLEKNKDGFIYVTHTSTPTVTMPRLKVRFFTLFFTN